MKKKLIFITVFSLVGLITFSQVNDSLNVPESENVIKKDQNDEIKTLFGSNISHGGYLAATANYSLIDGKEALALGGRFGWVIDHKLTIGLAGYGFANDIYIANVVENEGYNLAGGYGGIFLEPIIAPRFPVHISFPVLFGVGGIAYNKEITKWEKDNEEYEYDYYTEDSDAFMIIEPGLEIEMNVVKNLRIAFGASYRYAYDINLINTKSDILDGLTYGITFKIGKF